MATLFNMVVNPQLTSRSAFWGNYAALNGAEPPTPTAEAIHNYQLEKIKQSQEATLASARATKARFAEVEALIYGKNDVGEYTAEQDKEIQQSIQRIYETIGEIRSTKKSTNEDGSFKDAHLQKQQMDQLLGLLHTQLTTLKTKFQTTGVYEKDLLELETLIKSMSKFKTLSNMSFKSWYSRLSRLQGELLEQMGIAWGREVIPSDIEILDTAQVYLKTGSSGRHSGQLISDMIYLDTSKPEVLNQSISFSLGGKTQTMSLGDFISFLNNQSDKSQQIVIDDTAYDILLDASILQVQAKSGKTQLPWNVNASTTVAINDFSKEIPPNANISVLETFQLLQALDTEQPSDQWVINANADPYYQAMANYGLATALYKVMHLGVREGNQYLLTPNGLMTFSERIYQLFKDKPQLYIKFSGKVSMNGRLNSLDTQYKVMIPWQSLI